MILFYIALAFQTGLSSTYGYGERMCGDIGTPRPCSEGAITASGEPFDPQEVSGAVFAPKRLRMAVYYVRMRIGDGPCILVKINDKGNPRYIGRRGFDLTPGALTALTGSANPRWSGRVSLCKGDSYEMDNDSSPATGL